jgi:hypothetical protein
VPRIPLCRDRARPVPADPVRARGDARLPGRGERGAAAVLHQRRAAWRRQPREPVQLRASAGARLRAEQRRRLPLPPRGADARAGARGCRHLFARRVRLRQRPVPRAQRRREPDAELRRGDRQCGGDRERGGVRAQRRGPADRDRGTRPVRHSELGAGDHHQRRRGAAVGRAGVPGGRRLRAHRHGCAGAHARRRMGRHGRRDRPQRQGGRRGPARLHARHVRAAADHRVYRHPARHRHGDPDAAAADRERLRDRGLRAAVLHPRRQLHRRGRVEPAGPTRALTPPGPGAGGSARSRAPAGGPSGARSGTNATWSRSTT